MNLRRAVKDTWCWKFINTKPGKYIKFFIMLLLDMVNLGVDWYFYAKVELYQPGLVYGPPEPSIRWSILVFCIISCISFIIETIQNADDLFIHKKIPFLSQSFSNFCVIFFEDIPLLVLNLIVTLCRDGDPTVISVVKASVGIAVVVLRFVLMLFVYWLFDTKKNRFSTVCDILSSVGLFIVAGISISIQLLNNFPTNANGLIQSADPVTFNRMTYVSDKYFKNVGIYSKWPLDDTLVISNSTVEDYNSYIWLADIQEIVDNSYLSIKIRTDFNANSNGNSNYTMCLVKFKTTKCYSIQNLVLFEIDSSTIDLNNPSSVISNTGFDIAFTKEPAQEYKYTIGYLDYNLNKFTYVNSNKMCSPANAKSLVYAKFPSLESDKKNFFFKNSTSGYMFYNYLTDLLSVDKFWKTGIVGCRMSGDLGPKFNKDIHLTC